MKFINKDEKCNHCNREIEEVKVLHGFSFDTFWCPYCKERNQRK